MRPAWSRQHLGACANTSRWWRWTHGRGAPLRPAGPHRQLEAMRHARAASHAGVPRSPQPQRVLAARSDCGTSRAGCDHRCRGLVARADHPSRPLAAAPGTERRRSCNAHTGNFRPCTHSAFHADRSAHRHSARCGPGGPGPAGVCPVSRIGHPCGNLHRAGLTGRPLAGVPSDLRCSRMRFGKRDAPAARGTAARP
jgi:hypothetical protein